MINRGLCFDELTISRLFGNEAAENEEISRLKEYYFKNETYTQISANLPLRILVGHKGIGKSALFNVAQQEDMAKNIIVVSIKPDDIVQLNSDSHNFLSTIRSWKEGLSELIAKKILISIGSGNKEFGNLKQSGGKVLDFLESTFRNYICEANVDLTPAKAKLVQRFLRNHQVSVYIDDLDRGWKGRDNDITQLSALLNVVRDLSKENKGLNFKVSLRSDVYYLYRTSDESTDKIEGSVIWQSWTQHEILVMLIKRIETFFGRDLDQGQLRGGADISRYLNPVFERVFRGTGHWKNQPMHNVIMALNRKRPRDLVKLCTLAARSAREMGVSKIGTENMKAVFKPYSQGRLQDTINEYRSELPGIERLLMNMKPNREQRRSKVHKGYIYTTGELLKKISNIEQGGVFRFRSGSVATTKELAAFMYKINFLVARRPGRVERTYFEEDWYLLNQFADFGYHWEVHPAFRWALPMETMEDLYHQI